MRLGSDSKYKFNTFFGTDSVVCMVLDMEE